MFVVYFNATCAHLFTRLSFLTEIPSRRWYRIYATTDQAIPAGTVEAGPGWSGPGHVS
jgi:hypothetical protein